MRPSEWIADVREDGTAQVYAPSMGPCRVVVPIAETTAEHAKLIAAAPELLSALLVAEWRGAIDMRDGQRCPTCQMRSPNHHAKCGLNLALHIAGFTDQASRDAERERRRPK
jgi:hypothetical protein